MLNDFEPMLDGHLGCITAAEYHIKLVENLNKPIHSAPYRAGRKTWEFEKAEINKMTFLPVIQLT